MLLALASVAILYSQPNFTPQALLFPNADVLNSPTASGLDAQLSYLQLDQNGSNFSAQRFALNAPLGRYSGLQIGVQFPYSKQSYWVKSSADEYQLNTANPIPVLTLDAPYFSSRLSLDSVSHVAHWQNIFLRYQYFNKPVELKFESRSLDISAQSQFAVQGERLGAGWQSESRVLAVDFQNQPDGYRFASAYAQLPFMQGTFQVAYKEQQFRLASQWQTDGDFRAKTDAQLNYQDYSLGYDAQNWSLHYVQREVVADTVNQIDVNNSLATGFGKGRYFIIGGADFRQRSLAWQARFQLASALQLQIPIDLTFFDQLDIKADTYEPLLFLGLPKLTDSAQVNLKSAGLANLGVGLAGKVASWQWQAHLNQLVPFAIETIQAEQESTEKSDAKTHKKTGPLWPGLSLKLELSVDF